MSACNPGLHVLHPYVSLLFPASSMYLPFLHGSQLTGAGGVPPPPAAEILCGASPEFFAALPLAHFLPGGKKKHPNKYDVQQIKNIKKNKKLTRGEKCVLFRLKFSRFTFGADVIWI